MSELSDTSRTSPVASYPHHRECIECGYDIFQLNSKGGCPECGKPLAPTIDLPYWQLQAPWRLDISRAGLRVAACVAIATQLAASIAYLGTRSISGDLPLVFFLPALIAGVFYSVALFVLAAGVGGSIWKRWLPFCLFMASASAAVLLARLPADYSRNGWLNTALVFTAIWLVGRAHAAHVKEIGAGVGRRVTYLRARRFANVTRCALLAPAVFVWAFAVAACLFTTPSMTFDMVAPVTLAAAAVLAWLLIATVYWLMIARDCKPFTPGSPPHKLAP
ncbi:MAG TPA: hypothetical protein VFF65_10935 [Phycisphaerales bacterium]|nr:hypothetical protein [Phycisphaerales bacterium]